MANEHLVLVHGEGHGGWCWFKLRWLLEGSGYRVTCIDLAGGGVDPTDPNTVRSFEQYDKPLLDLISALPEGEKVSSCAYLDSTYGHRLVMVVCCETTCGDIYWKWWKITINLVYHAKLVLVEFQVILIGHGIGGLSVIHAMHEFVDRIKEAIFVAAAMLPFGLQTDEDKKDVMFSGLSFCSHKV